MASEFHCMRSLCPLAPNSHHSAARRNPVKVRETGVRYSDVAGIDNIKTEIQEVIDILLGKEEYIAMGAKPFRVSVGGVWREGVVASGTKPRWLSFGISLLHSVAL